ncbi:MAG: cell division protein FtsL [Paracoccaceae bacterium]|nr:cell division protein FtsL [Paracoccaceae bacterium]
MRMIILSVLSFLCILSAIWAYQVNYQTRSVKKDIQVLNDKIVSILNRIDLLEAEWAFLNRPKRLAKLVDDNFETLRLVPITKDHFQNSPTSYLTVVESKDGE